eukprot:COSAG02_NODE_53928_length_299_cov_0.595000_1_plen_35_part_10
MYTQTSRAKLRYYPSMPGALASIMPGQTWRVGGQK